MIGTFTTRPMTPFGLEVHVPLGRRWEDISAEQLHAWVAEHRVVVIRGLPGFAKTELPAAARRLGPLQPWEFGAVNELKPEADTRNYLYTRRPVPLHWDGAFAGKVPRYLFFQCLAAPDPDAGGETVFVDTTRVWRSADEATRDRWRALRFTYETQKVVHYGGQFTAAVVAQHPHTHETVLRFAEPVDDLNPVSVRAEGLSPLESAAMITELRSALQQPDVVLAHRWEPGDVVIADNHALLHGRRAFERDGRRHLQRVNVHDDKRTFRDAIRDSLAIRRPEFMVAEVPILLIPALLCTTTVSDLVTERFGVTVALFFLLFHFGDIINCLADRDLDAVYKTHLSESVYGLGVKNVRWQLGITTVLSLVLTAWLAISTERHDITLLVAGGLFLAAQYSIKPLHLKGRGPLQVLTLWAVIFVVPMLLVARVFLPELPLLLLLLILAYGAMQEGIILVNTAEDLPEDRAAGINTTAVSLGLANCIRLSLLMVALGGAVTTGVLGWMVSRTTGNIPLSVLPLVGAWLWVCLEVWATWRAVHRGASSDAMEALRKKARRMPAWITATAWGTLIAAACVPAGALY